MAAHKFDFIYKYSYQKNPHAADGPSHTTHITLIFLSNTDVVYVTPCIALKTKDARLLGNIFCALRLFPKEPFN